MIWRIDIVASVLNHMKKYKFFGTVFFILISLGSAPPRPTENFQYYSSTQELSNQNLLDAGTGSVVAIRQLQSRVFRTNDLQKVSNVVQEALMDLGFVGTMTGNNGEFNKTPISCGTPNPRGCHYYANVLLKLDSKQQYVIVRVVLKNMGRDVQQGNIYQQFFASVSKSLFLEGQQIDPTTLD
jgi:hypothetical protein